MTDKTYDLSIIVPIYNAEEHIGECLDSILLNKNCDFNIQVILVDDGSIDNSYDICKKKIENLEDCILIKQNNQGVSAARNRGLADANSEYVMFVDSDDLLKPNIVKKMLCAVEDYDLYIGGYDTFEGKKSVNSFFNCNYCGTTHDFAHKIEKWIYPPYILSPWAKLFKMKVIMDNGLKFCDEMSYGEDAAFVFSYLMVAKTIMSCKEIVYSYRTKVRNSLSSNFNNKMMIGDMIVNKILLDYLNLHNVVNAKEIVYKRIVQNFCGHMRKMVTSNMPYREKKAIFYRYCDKYNMQAIFSSLKNLRISERIVFFVSKNNNRFWVMFIFYVRDVNIWKFR